MSELKNNIGNSKGHLMTESKDSKIADCIVERLENFFKDHPRPVELHGPVFDGNEEKYVRECVVTRWVSSAGAFVGKFEQMLAEYTGSPYAVAVTNGTVALHMALLLAGVERGEEVLIPSLTFVATANAVSHAGAIPHLCDVSETTLGLDPVKLADWLDEIGEKRDGKVFNRLSGRAIGAIMPMHAFGHPVQLDELLAIAEKWGLPLVEDAAESLGSFYKGRHTGTISGIAALSFNGNKTVTTGGGGALLIRDPELAKKAKHLTTTAKKPHAYRFIHDDVGYNYRMPNINAALGVAQMESLERFLERKRQLVAEYQRLFADLADCKLFVEPSYAKSNYWLNCLILQGEQAIFDQTCLESIFERLAEKDIQTRPFWEPMHKLPMYESCPSMPLSVSESLNSRTVCIPSGPGL
ncbi:MAG: LegC family aminotransferase [Candidatus Obscuribacterales bacterium]|nr:LegC family aminotransferase [Candidatus Obscuribacterales bacterium]